MKQYIIVRKDLKMSMGKFAAQVSHASMAFLAELIKNHYRKILARGYHIAQTYSHVKIVPYRRHELHDLAVKAAQRGQEYFKYYEDERTNQIIGLDDDVELPCECYQAFFNMSPEIINDWFKNDFTKVILEAKNKNKLLSAIEKAKELNIEYYPIYDKCYTELTPEEENGTTLTCIGFPPIEEDKIIEITKKYQLYK